MNRALQITYRGMAASNALNEHIRGQADKLEQFFDGIVGCYVVVEEPHRHKQQGKHFHVRVDVQVPGKSIVAARDPEQRTGHEDAYQAVTDAFDAARRQLQHYVDARHDHRH
jgi:ribosomal subunit interface protein